MRLVKILFVVAIHFTSLLFAQPDYDSKTAINGIHIYQDNTDPLLFYYEPGVLVLARNGNGKPDFQFLDMRYTGSKCYNDQGEKNFMSLVQFTVEMTKIEADDLKAARKNLKKRNIKLIPLPITHITSKLIIAPIENSDNGVMKEGALEATGKDGYSTSKVFWTKRSFVVKLNNHESQVLNDQLSNGRLGMSLAYSYNSDFKINEDIEAKGSPELLEAVLEANKDDEVMTENRIVKSDAIAIGIDVKKYPGTIMQIDLNKEMPPAYAGTEIRCYDFKNKLRPDLYIKIVEIQAQSVDNEKEVIVEARFLKNHSDIYTKHISFPYAIYVNAPMRYRITEITNEGERMVSDWKNKESCSSVIDITTQF